MRLRIITVLLCILLPNIAFSSPGYGDCKYRNPELKHQLSKGRIKELLYGNDGDACLWATSTLKPEGRPPSIEENDIAYYEFLSKYSPSKAYDGQKHTVWSEGAAGDGVGEIVLLPIDLSKPIRIWNGMAKSKRLFQKNNRIKRARIYFLVPGDIVTESEGVYYFKNLKVVETHEIQLTDTFGSQKLAVPPLAKSKMPDQFRNYNGVLPTTVIGIEILSVFQGSQYGDTVISEVLN